MIVLGFVVCYFMSILVLQTAWWGIKRELVALLVLQVSHGCCVAFPCGAMGLSVVCDCGIS